MLHSTPPFTTFQADIDGTRRWHLNGKRHRIDGPAIEYADGQTEWWLNDELHRVDGPAIEEADGGKAWYLNGKQISAPYSHVLTAVFLGGLPIPPEVFPDMFKAMLEAACSKNNELNQVNIILHKHWPTAVKEILVALFMDSDPDIKHLAFSLLGRRTLPQSPAISTHL